MNSYRSRLINFTEVLFPAYRKGEKLESYDASRETWWQLDALNHDDCFRSYLCADCNPHEFWDLRIAPKPEPKMPEDPVAASLAKARQAMSPRDCANLLVELEEGYKRGEKIEFYDSDERGWREVDFDDEDASCVLDQSASYRIAPKPEPKMPDAPVFWVREKEDLTRMTLVMEIAGSKFIYLTRDRNRPYHIEDLVEAMHWSPDRKNWFDFRGRPVS